MDRWMDGWVLICMNYKLYHYIEVRANECIGGLAFSFHFPLLVLKFEF